MLLNIGHATQLGQIDAFAHLTVIFIEPAIITLSLLGGSRRLPAIKDINISSAMSAGMIIYANPLQSHNEKLMSVAHNTMGL